MFLVNAEQYVKDKNEYMYQFEYVCADTTVIQELKIHYTDPDQRA